MKKTTTKYSILSVIAFCLIGHGWLNENKSIAINESAQDNIPSGRPTRVQNISDANKTKSTGQIKSQLKENLINYEEIKTLTQNDFIRLSKVVTPTELAMLKSKILSTTEKNEKRQAYLYLLSQLGSSATDHLTDIVKATIPTLKNTHDPHSISSIQKQFEISIRLTALETLDKLVIDNPEIKIKIESILDVQKDQVLIFLTQISLSGIKNNNPGKLKRFIDEVLNKRDI